MISFEEFMSQMDKYSEALTVQYTPDDPSWDKIYEEVSEYQKSYMTELINNYNDDTLEKEEVVEMIWYLIDDSESGNTNTWVNNKKFAEEIREVFINDFYDYLLDYPEITEVDRYGEEGYVVNVTFIGYATPYWNGWAKDSQKKYNLLKHILAHTTIKEDRYGYKKDKGNIQEATGS